MMFNDTDSINDILFPPAPTNERKLGKFQPKTRAKPIKSPFVPSSKSDASQAISANLESPGSTVVKIQEKQLSLSTSSSADLCYISQDHNTHQDPRDLDDAVVSEALTSKGDIMESSPQDKVLGASSNTFDGSQALHSNLEPPYNPDLKLQAVVSDSSTFGGNNLNSFQQEKVNSGEDADTFFGLDSPEDPWQSFSITGRAVDRLRLAKDMDLVMQSTAVVGVSESMVVSNPNSDCLLPEAEDSRHGDHVQESHEKLQPDFDKPETDAILEFPGIGSPVDLFHPEGYSAVRQVGKFKPKSLSQPKQRKAKSVSFILPHAPEITPTVGFFPETTDISAQEIRTDEYTDNPLHSLLITLDCSGDFKTDHQSLVIEDMPEQSGFETYSDGLSQPASNPVRPLGKFQPKPNAKEKTGKSSTCSGATDIVSLQPDSSSTEAGCFDHNASGLSDDTFLQSLSFISSEFDQEQVNHPESVNFQAALSGSNIMQTSETASDGNGIGDGWQSQDIEEQRQRSQEEALNSKSVEDVGASELVRKLRKRVDKRRVDRTEGTSNGDMDVEDANNISQMDEDQNDEEFKEENVTQKKRAPKRSKQTAAKLEKPLKRSERVSKRSGSTEEETQKKFPHSTRRKRRQVDKALLETPEYEINPRQLSIKDLILLAEAKERKSIKEVTLTKSFPNQSNSSSLNNEDISFGDDQEVNHGGDEESPSIQPTQKILNYHSYMNRPQTVRWSKSETELLYEAIRQFGTDFAMIQLLFPHRTRHQVKLKFKNEERKHPFQVHDALLHRSNDHSQFKQVIEQLQATREQTSKQDKNDPASMSQDAAGENGVPMSEHACENEEEREELQKEEDDENGWDPHSTDSKYGVDSPKFNEYQSAFEWDAGGDSYPEDMEKYTT